MPPFNFVSVRIHCRCSEIASWCVRIDRNVPEPLRCTPRGGGGGGATAVLCPRCGQRCFDSPADLEAATNAATRSGWGEWIREGAVVLEC